MSDTQAKAVWSIGIDLGTTHCAMSIRKPGESTFRLLPIPQFVSEGQYTESDLLPSFGLQPEAHQRDALTNGLPWVYHGGLVVGEWARRQAYSQPGRVVTSAKSWLSHADVDRTANILPWGADEGVTTCSPVVASSAYLKHLRQAFESAYPDVSALSEQNVTLTVPASFDSVARELTVRAAEIGGIGSPTLLEEPQAALYAWLYDSGEDWRDRLSPGDVVLVCDVGGGTTDFSLIKIAESEGDLQLERIAVGDHILLGGDNMDLTLAFVLRQHLQKTQQVKVDRWQFQSLTQACREAKERLFSDPQLDNVPIAVASRGSKLIGGTIRTELSRAVLNQVLVEGFFPKVDWQDQVRSTTRSALSEVGLPYASDAAITRHLSSFLRAHAKGETPMVCPTAVLFNGGVFQASTLQDRVESVLNDWLRDHSRSSVKVLTSASLNVSVAKGAAYFGDVTQGDGIRIRGGVAHSYYVGVEEAMPAIPGFAPPINAVCIVPFGTEEETSLSLPNHLFALRTNQQAEFRLFVSATRTSDAVGAVVEMWDADDLRELPSVEAALGASADTAELVEVSLQTELTSVGTLRLFCVESGGESRRWGLEFNIRATEASGNE